DAILVNEQAAGWKFLDFCKTGSGCRDITKGQKFTNGTWVYSAGAETGEHRFDLRSESNTVSRLRKEQRFFARSIPREHQSFFCTIPQCNRKHPTQMLNEVQSVLLVEMQDRFGIRGSCEFMALGLKRRGKRLIIVDLSIEHQLES